MTESTTEEQYTSIDTAIKSISIKQLEECIAAAIEKTTGSSKINMLLNLIVMHKNQMEIK